MNEPAWMTHLVDQRLAMVEHAVGRLPGYDVVFTFLVENPLISAERNDRTCDNPGCQAYCPHPTPFYTGILERELKNGRPVKIGFGVCKTCKSSL